MSRPITISPGNWIKLQDRLRNDNHSSVMLIREKMKVVLGFTVRHHREWKTDPSFGNYLEEIVCLDFYNEPKRTMFMLKYSEYLEKSGKD